jgi:hypothetical protein
LLPQSPKFAHLHLLLLHPEAESNEPHATYLFIIKQLPARWNTLSICISACSFPFSI